MSTTHMNKVETLWMSKCITSVSSLIYSQPCHSAEEDKSGLRDLSKAETLIQENSERLTLW